MSSALEAADVYGKTALHKAAEKKDLQRMINLVSLGANIDAKDVFNHTPLHIAAICNHGDSHFSIIELLLQKGAHVNAQDKNENTPLHLLIGRASVKTVQLLLHFNAFTYKLNTEGENCLFVAMREKNIKVVKFLLSRDGSIKNEVNVVNGSTSLHYASRYCDPIIVNFFLKDSADTVNISVKNKAGNTPFFEAIRGGKITIIQQLLNHGANINSIHGQDGSTPLHYASRYSDDVKIIRFFLERGVYPVDVENKLGNTPLFEAVRRGNIDIVKQLLEYGADVNFVNKLDGKTPLHHAYLNGNNAKVIR